MPKHSNVYLTDDKDLYIRADASGISLWCSAADGLDFYRFVVRGRRVDYHRVEDAIAWHEKEAGQLRNARERDECLEMAALLREQLGKFRAGQFVAAP